MSRQLEVMNTDRNFIGNVVRFGMHNDHPYTLEEIIRMIVTGDRLFVNMNGRITNLGIQHFTKVPVNERDREIRRFVWNLPEGD